MNMTSSSLSYFFMAIGILSLIFLFYFRIIVANTSKDNSHRDKIIGSMKDPEAWRARNNRLSYIFLFWSILSLAIFIYLKYFFGMSVVSGIYVIAYLAVMVISIALFGNRRKATT